MRTETRKELMSVSSSICITEIARIAWEDGESLLVNNTEPVTVGGKEYSPCSFRYSPPGDNAEGSLEIDDIDGSLTYAIQSTDKMSVEISLIDTDDTSYIIEGPVFFTAESASATSKGSVSLDISMADRMNYGLSKCTYSAMNFPGLF